MKTVDPLLQHQEAYTHGLEAIYSLEEVDIKTVRPIEPVKPHLEEPPQCEFPSLELALGLRFQEEKLPFSFTNWLLEILKGGDALKTKALLFSYDLEIPLLLDQRQEFEWRRSTPERKAIWAEEAAIWIKQHQKPDLKSFVDAYLIPWMWKRGGIANRTEMMERVFAIATQPEIADKVISFIDDLFFDQSFSLGKQLVFIEKNLFAVQDAIAKEVHKALDIALSYFYRPGLCYSHEELLQLIQKEIAPKWVSFTDGLVERVLRLSCHFFVFKGEKGKLMIKRQALQTPQGAGPGFGS